MRESKAEEVRAWVIHAAQALDGLKADDIRVLDLRGKSSFADYFVIASGSTALHMRALADRVTERLRVEGQRPRHAEGREGDRWILLDYIEFVVHVFSTEGRAYYGLEHFWGDSEVVEWERESPALSVCAS